MLRKEKEKENKNQKSYFSTNLRHLRALQSLPPFPTFAHAHKPLTPAKPIFSHIQIDSLWMLFLK